jgi:hypothetical protein
MDAANAYDTGQVDGPATGRAKQPGDLRADRHLGGDRFCRTNPGPGDVRNRTQIIADSR